MNQRTLSPFWTLFILTGLNLLNYLDRQIIPTVLTPLQNEFHLTDDQLGRINTIFMIGYFVTSPFFGYLGDRMARKWLIALGIFIWSLGTVLTGFAGGFALLLFFRVLVGVGEASYATISPSLISDTFPTAKRNNALTIFYVAIPVGSALGYLLGAYMVEHHTWRSAFIWAGAPGLVLALLLLPFKEPKRGQSDHQTVTKPKPRDLLKLIALTDYQLVVWGYVAYTFAVGGFAFWGPQFLIRIHQVPPARASVFFGGVLVLTGLLGTLIGGFAATAWQKRNPAGYALMLGCSTLAAVPAVLTAFSVGNTTLAMSFLALGMFLLFLSTGPVNTLILETVPVNLRASAMAISIFMIHLFGDMWSAEIVGHLSQHWNNLQKAVLILPVALLVSGSLWLGLALKTLKTRKSHAK